MFQFQVFTSIDGKESLKTFWDIKGDAIHQVMKGIGEDNSRGVYTLYTL